MNPRPTIRCVAPPVLLGLALFFVPAARGGDRGRAGIERVAVASSGRTIIHFDRDWRFSRGDFPAGAHPAFDDSSWQSVTLPHDWSISGPFGPENASGTGYAPSGVGWYRKHFRLDPAAKVKIVRVEFDGIYNHSQIWMNGHLVGGRPSGYTSFECDLTPHLKFVSAENVLAIRVNHSKSADSRWYTGSGIYRDVRLRITNKLRVPQWGVFVSTPEVEATSCMVEVRTAIENDRSRRSQPSRVPWSRGVIASFSSG